MGIQPLLGSEIHGSEYPAILANRQRCHEFRVLCDSDVTAEGHGALDDDLVFAKFEDLHSPDQIRADCVGVRFIHSLIGMSDRDLDRTASFRDLLEETLPLVGSASGCGHSGDSLS